MSKFEGLTNKIVEKSPSRTKVNGKRLRKGRESDDERGSFEQSLESESELEEQVRQKEKKIKINSSRDKANKRNECQKGSGSESEHEYDGSVFMLVMTVNWHVT